MFRIITVLVVGLVVGTMGYAFYQETGLEGVGLFAVLAMVIGASVCALLFSPPPKEEETEPGNQK